MKRSLLKEIIKNELKKLFEAEPDPNAEPELNIGDKIEPEAEPTPKPYTQTLKPKLKP